MERDRWIRAKRLVLARDGHCLRCLGEAEVVHHRIPRGMGGAGPEVSYGLANLVCLCNPCHNWCHENPAEAYDLGFLLHQWDDPEDVPLTVKPGTRWVLLTNRGEMNITQQLALF
jgi:hypothetical protein